MFMTNKFSGHFWYIWRQLETEEINKNLDEKINEILQSIDVDRSQVVSYSRIGKSGK